MFVIRIDVLQRLHFVDCFVFLKPRRVRCKYLNKKFENCFQMEKSPFTKLVTCIFQRVPYKLCDMFMISPLSMRSKKKGEKSALYLCRYFHRVPSVSLYTFLLHRYPFIINLSQSLRKFCLACNGFFVTGRCTLWLLCFRCVLHEFFKYCILVYI